MRGRGRGRGNGLGLTLDAQLDLKYQSTPLFPNMSLNVFKEDKDDSLYEIHTALASFYRSSQHYSPTVQKSETHKRYSQKYQAANETAGAGDYDDTLIDFSLFPKDLVSSRVSRIKTDKQADLKKLGALQLPEGEAASDADDDEASVVEEDDEDEENDYGVDHYDEEADAIGGDSGGDD